MPRPVTCIDPHRQTDALITILRCPRRRNNDKVSPRARRDDMPTADRQWHIVSPPIRPSRIQKSRRIYVRPRTGPQSAHFRWRAVAKLQAASVCIQPRKLRRAASVPIAYAGIAAPWDRQTDGSRYSQMPPSLLGREHDKFHHDWPSVRLVSWPSVVRGN